MFAYVPWLLIVDSRVKPRTAASKTHDDFGERENTADTGEREPLTTDIDELAMERPPSRVGGVGVLVRLC